jgi:hypothetical protein
MDDSWADPTPGDEASLLALYAAVPGAEEIDLAEEASWYSTEVREALVLIGRGEAPPRSDVDADLEDDEGEADEPTPLTDGQARGVLEQLLGAEPVDDDGDDER